MNKCTSQEQKPTYEVTGPDLFIFWDEEQIEREEETVWQYSYLQTTSKINRNQLIEQLMACKFSIGAEFAAINNGGDDYAEYLAYRDQCKTLADGYFG